jgi:hypothetical protein
MNIREKWLLALLTGVFAIQAGTLIYGVHLCSQVKPDEDVSIVCPRLGERFDNTFGTMIATTLALLTGGSIASAVKPKVKPNPKTIIPPVGRT